MPTGFRLDVTCGEALITITDKIKQLTDAPIVEGVSGIEGWQNIDGGTAGTNYGGIDAIVGGDASGS